MERICGTYDNPELLAIGLKGPAQPLYRVRFKQADVWPEYVGHPNDSVDVEVYQPWLDSAAVASNFSCEPPVRFQTKFERASLRFRVSVRSFWLIFVEKWHR